MNQRPYPMAAAGGHPSRKTPARVAAAVVAAGLLAARLAAAPAADTAPPDTPVTALWTSLPLRDWAARATALAGRPVVVDRRLDPETTVSRDCRGESLRDVLAAVAATAGGTVEPLRSWIRIAPAAEAGRATRGERERLAELAALPTAARATPAARRAWSWPDGARPRDLVAAAAAEAGVALAGLDAVPHDHLPGASLPPLSLAERLDLVLAHYDLRVAWTAADDVAEGRIVPLAAADGPPPVAAGARPRPAPRGPAATTADRYTLRLAAPLDETLAALGPRLGLEVELDRESLAARGILPGEIVRATVTDASREQLLDAILGPPGLRWRIEGRRLLVDAPPR